MTECSFRTLIKVEDVVVIKDKGLIDGMVASTNMMSNFCYGMCSLLTAFDMGPVKCDQPEADEHNCPSIKEYRK